MLFGARIVRVTGASRGIGQAIARLVAAGDAQVAINLRSNRARDVNGASYLRTCMGAGR